MIVAQITTSLLLRHFNILPTCAELGASTFLVRASEDDNPAVAQACMEALDHLGFAAV